MLVYSSEYLPASPQPSKVSDLLPAGFSSRGPRLQITDLGMRPLRKCPVDLFGPLQHLPIVTLRKAA
jgi:hypothetical protein